MRKKKRYNLQNEHGTQKITVWKIFFFSGGFHILVFRRAVCFIKHTKINWNLKIPVLEKETHPFRYKKMRFRMNFRGCTVTATGILFAVTVNPKLCSCTFVTLISLICSTYHVLPIFEMFRICCKLEKYKQQPKENIPWIYRPPTMPLSPPALLHF